ncbi:MAG TPA: hypothetical protein VEC76_13990 [Streptosporangiaceae bacterium]|nr:hypothetical protein [Streptosporangiaceae bacterium]
MAKNLLRSVMAASFRRSETTAGNVTRQPVLAHEAITSFSRGQRLTTAYGIMVVAVDGDHIIEITGFADPALFPVFGLPVRREA